MNKRTVFHAALAVCLTAASALGHAQSDYPNRAIKLVVPYSSGGLPDTVARLVGQRLSEALNQPVYVDNKPGGNGSVAAAALATSPADGYTFLVTDGSMLTINPLLYSKLGYDATKDFIPVSLIARSPLFLVVNPQVPAKTFDEFMKLARSKPGELNYGSSGVGSTHHLSGAALAADTGIKMTHIPFRGSANSVPALVGGQVDMVFSAYPSIAGFVKTGQARILATNGAKRSSFAPDAPAIAETVPGYDFSVIVAMLAPKGTPQAIVDKVSKEVDKLVKRPDVIEQMHTAGIEPVGGDAPTLGKALTAERQRMVGAVKAANLKVE